MDFETDSRVFSERRLSAWFSDLWISFNVSGSAAAMTDFLLFASSSAWLSLLDAASSSFLRR
jgi:hypothetical protein